MVEGGVFLKHHLTGRGFFFEVLFCGVFFGNVSVALELANALKEL